MFVYVIRYSFTLQFSSGAAEILSQCLSRHDIILMSDRRRIIVSGQQRGRLALLRGNSAIRWSSSQRKSRLLSDNILVWSGNTESYTVVCVCVCA